MIEGNCRLCSTPSAAVINEAVMCFGATAAVAEVLNKHFWFELHSERDAAAFVCQSCWQKVDAFHQFYQSVLVVQTRTPADEHFVDVEGKLEINLDASSSDDESNNGAFADIKEEEHDRDEDANSSKMYPETQSLPEKRRPGRPRKVVSYNDIKLEDPSDDEPSGTKRVVAIKAPDSSDKDPAVDNALLTQYFTLQCDVCAVPLPNLELARSHHQQVHKKRGYLQCGCGRRFVRNATIRDHCAFHADPSLWKCMECCKIFVNFGRLQAHRKFKHPLDEATNAAIAALGPNDGEAEKEDGSPYSLEQQRRDDELLRRYLPMNCGLCGVGYETFAEARKHHQAEHGQRGYMECCNKRFGKKCRAVQHARWHENPRQFDCTMCTRSFTDSVALRDHTIRRHPSNAPFSYQCDQCEVRFQLIVQLRYHQQRNHLAPDAKKFECFMCHRMYMYMSQLRTHMREAHDRVGPTHMCDVCARCFKSKATYELHYAVEHGTVPLKRQCLECGKWLKHAGMLARHMFEHRSVPQTCADCGHVAPSRRSLSAHRRRLHRAPKHKCMACGKMFKTVVTLREHLAIHAGITDLYSCAYCPKTFRSNANMYKHRRQVHAAQFEVDQREAKLALDARNAEELAAASVTMQAQASRPSVIEQRHWL